MPETQYFGARGAIYTTSGAPVATGTDETQTIIGNSTVTGGTFKLSFQGFISADISWTATTSIMETALNNLKSLGAGGTAATGVAVTGGALPGTSMTITFSGTNVRKKAQPLLVLHSNSLTGGGSMTIAEGIPGVDRSYPTAPNGALLVREDTGALFVNTSGTWTAQA